MRSTRFAAAIVAFLGVLPITQTALAGPGDPWVIDGGGWGHGIGLSQFGALGQAEAGRTAEQIIQFYYTGTQVEAPLPGNHWTTQPEGMKVGLAANATIVDIKAVGGQLRLCQPEDCSLVDLIIEDGAHWKFEVVSTDPLECRFREVDVDHTDQGPCTARIEQDPSTSVRIALNGVEYAHGSVGFAPTSTGFHATLAIDLELYLRGLDEVPSSWPGEALKAQAIIGRSYAVATAVARGGPNGSSELSSCGCHLRSTTVDQAYDGWSKENSANGGAAWVAAVGDTEGQVVTHDSLSANFGIATTFYSSSNGGWSENNEDVWGGTPRPWLRSVKDDWSADPAVNPLARWTILVSDANMAIALGWDRAFEATVLTGPPGAIVRFTGRDQGVDVSKDLNGTQIRTILNAFGYRSDGGTVRVSPYILDVVDPVPFDDVAGTLFENAISWLADEGITQGCNPPANSLFCPNGKVTRGEMAVFISRALSLPAPTADHFGDDTGRFYEGAANRLFEAGITVGCGGSRFCGDRLLPREQMAVFLVRANGLPAVATDYFTDDENSPFEDHINRIAEAKITLGCNPPSNTHFCPNDTVTRGEMAAFFKRAWGP